MLIWILATAGLLVIVAAWAVSWWRTGGRDTAKSRHISERFPTGGGAGYLGMTTDRDTLPNHPLTRHRPQQDDQGTSSDR